jgi:hypothetical protein
MSRRSLAVLPRLLVPVVLLALTLGLAGPASAASWTTVLKAGGARSQACKAPTADGKYWKIRVRLVNRDDTRWEAGYSVTKGDKTLQRVNLVARPGRTTKVRTLTVRRGSGQQVGAGMSNGEGGFGDSAVLSVIGRC